MFVNPNAKPTVRAQFSLGTALPHYATLWLKPKAAPTKASRHPKLSPVLGLWLIGGQWISDLEMTFGSSHCGSAGKESN